MRIRVASDESNFNIPLPNWLLLNSLSAAIGKSIINRHLSKNASPEAAHIPLSYLQLRRMFLEIRRCSRYLKGEPLVYAETSDGSIVEIYL